VFGLSEQLQNYTGKKIVIELINGRKISGVVLSSDQLFIRLESDEGVGIIPITAVNIVWETLNRSVTGEQMDQIAEQMKDSAKQYNVCPCEFSCPGSYTCASPYACHDIVACGASVTSPCTLSHTCTPPFNSPPMGCGMPYMCPAKVAGMFPPGGCPAQVMSPVAEDNAKVEIACTAFPGFTCSQQYICRPPDTCTFSFACPGSFVPGFPSGGGGCPFFSCGPFQFGACGPFQFGACGPFQFGGSQCGVLGGFICGGAQFFGAPIRPPGMVSAETLPKELDIKDIKDKKTKKE